MSGNWYGKRAIDRLLAGSLDRVVRAGARPFLRTMLGRWPDRAELHDFRVAHAAGGHLPRPLHALSTLGGARRLLTAAGLEALLPEPVQGSTAGLLLTRRPRAAFLHIEKTAGTSVQEFLLDQYHPVQVGAPPADGPTAARTLLADPTLRQRALLHGHYNLPLLRRADPDRLVFTLLREPRARILSLYYYWRSSRPASEGGEPHPAAVAAARLDLLAFLNSGMEEVRNAIDNVYARRLTGWSVEGATDALSADPAAALAASETALAGLCCVGVTEQMHASLQVIASRLQLIPPSAAPRVNVGADNIRTLPQDFRPVAREPLTAPIAAALDRLTRLDSVLYAQAAERLATDIASMTDAR